MAKGTENIRPKGVMVVLDKQRHLRFTFGGLEFLAEKYGSIQDALAALQELQTGITARGLGAITDFAYAGLMHEDISLTRDSLANIIDMSMINDLAQAIALSLAGSNPEPKKAEGAENPQ